MSFRVNSTPSFIPRQNIAFKGNDENDNSLVKNVAVGAAVSGVGAGVGAGAAKLFTKPSGQITNVTTLEGVVLELGKEGDSAIKGPVKRTAEKAKAVFEKIKSDTSAENIKTLTTKAENILKDGTRPYAKFAIIGAVVGAAAFVANHLINGKKDNAAAESLKPLS